MGIGQIPDLTSLRRRRRQSESACRLSNPSLKASPVAHISRNRHDVQNLQRLGLTRAELELLEILRLGYADDR